MAFLCKLLKKDTTWIRAPRLQSGTTVHQVTARQPHSPLTLVHLSLDEPTVLVALLGLHLCWSGTASRHHLSPLRKSEGERKPLAGL